MGTWGAGPFDNDDAADWAWSLEDSTDDAVLRAALEDGAERAKPDASISQVAIAAAAVVVAGRSGDSGQLPEEVAAWLVAHRDLPWSELANLARAALANVANDSELLDLWAESDDAQAWRGDLSELQARL
jgi:hypothetical protein